MRHGLIAIGALLVALNNAAAQTGAGAAATGADADLDMLSRAGEARAIGPDSAKVVLIEFLDFACATCQAFHAMRADSLRKALGSDVRLVYVHLLHANFLRSYHAAEAAACAAGLGGRDAYHRMSDRLFSGASTWAEAGDPSATFAGYARDLGLDAAQFAQCRDRDTMSPLLVSDMTTANTFGVTGTPTFIFVPRGAQGPDEALHVAGNVPIAQITDLIAQARAKAK